MKRVRCPKCDNFITFDETKYEAGQSLVFECPECGKQFGIRMGVSKLRATRKEETFDENANEKGCGSIVVIENVFHYKQVIPLQMGDNVIGRYMKGSKINCPIETVDPSIDMTHCVINVSRDKQIHPARRPQLHRHIRGQRDIGRPRAARHRRRNALHPRCHLHHLAHPRQRRRITGAQPHRLRAKHIPLLF